eukprot:TRINITY_DN421_c0_g1_i1.p1 TRINITY_DN421_c0_g1~~TRINITY_DN421_c0_g1_i1.p1  ORF type:complete len:188 (+),score=11.67 TRINITY_DN421_c0_g1_i1:368-931(+)
MRKSRKGGVYVLKHLAESTEHSDTLWYKNIPETDLPRMTNPKQYTNVNGDRRLRPTRVRHRLARLAKHYTWKSWANRVKNMANTVENMNVAHKRRIGSAKGLWSPYEELKIYHHAKTWRKDEYADARKAIKEMAEQDKLDKVFEDNSEDYDKPFYADQLDPESSEAATLYPYSKEIWADYLKRWPSV